MQHAAHTQASPTGNHAFTTDAPAWLAPSDGFLRQFLQLPQLALVEESCAAERALHAALLAQPTAAVGSAALQSLADDDVRSSYTLFLRCRDRLLAAGTLEAYYLSLFPTHGTGVVDIPPLFIDLIVEAITRHVMGPLADAEPDDHFPWQARAAQMLYRRQRISTDAGQVLSGDQQTLDMLQQTGGVGDFGRFLQDAGAPLASINLQVLGEDNAADFQAAYLAPAGPGRDAALRYLLDLRHEVSNDLSHGLVLTMTRARSGLKALALVLQKWVAHFLRVAVRIQPLQKIDDPAWRWHVGLDAEAMLLLNDLYQGAEVEPARLQRLVSLFRLDFVNPLEMRADVAGKPVYLGMMMNAAGVLQLKPQNLLANLPLQKPV